MNQATIAVNRGVKLLDTFVPNWIKKVKPEHLKMSDNNQCMLGQTLGEFCGGCQILAEKAVHKAVGALKLSGDDIEIDGSYYGI